LVEERPYLSQGLTSGNVVGIGLNQPSGSREILCEFGSEESVIRTCFRDSVWLCGLATC
jgi:hypothetical protein